MSAPAVLADDAPAKVNLTLRVLARRADGYHELESLVVFAAFGDRLSFCRGGDLALTVRGPSAAAAGEGGDNLVHKAARALAARRPGVVLGAFDLDKKVQRRIAIRRRNELMKQQAKISKHNLSRLVGRKTEVLFEGRSEESDLLLQGRMQTQAPDIDGHVLINDIGEADLVPGGFYGVEITDSLEYDVIGRIVNSHEMSDLQKRN